MPFIIVTICSCCFFIQNKRVCFVRDQWTDHLIKEKLKLLDKTKTKLPIIFDEKNLYDIFNEISSSYSFKTFPSYDELLKIKNWRIKDARQLPQWELFSHWIEKMNSKIEQLK